MSFLSSVRQLTVVAAVAVLGWASAIQTAEASVVLGCSTTDINGSAPAVSCVNTPRGGRGMAAQHRPVNGANRLPGFPAEWVYDGHQDSGAPAAGSNIQFFSAGYQGSPINQLSGTWRIRDYNPNRTYALSIWGGSNLVTYVLPAGKSQGTWSTLGLPNPAGRQAAFSGGGLAYIPLPAAAWLMIAGLGGLGLVAWRRERVAA